MREKRKGRKLISRIFAGLICAVLVATLLPGISSKAVNVDMTGEQVPTYKIQVKDGSSYRDFNPTSDVITSLDTEIRILYSWAENKTLAQLGFNESDTYNLPTGSLKNIQITNASGPMLSGGVQVGTIAGNEGGTATITFNSEALSMDHFQAELKCRIDPNAAAETADGEVTLEFGTQSVKVKVQSLEAAGPSIAKTSSGISGDIITWTIKYTEPQKFYNGGTPETINDVIPAGLEFVAITEPASGVTGSASGQNLTITLDSSWGSAAWTTPARTHTIKYTTKLTEAEKGNLLNGSGNKSYVNSASLEGKDGGGTNAKTFSSDIKATATINQSDYSAIEKPSGTHRSSAKEIDWTIRVNPFGMTFSDDTLITDTMGTGLTYKAGTLKVWNGTAYVDLTPTTNNHVDGGKDTLGFTYASLIAVGAAPNSSGKYEIKYTTTVDPSVYGVESSSAPESIKNDVNIDWKLKNNTSISGTKGVTGVGPGKFSTEKVRKKTDTYSFDEKLDGYPVARLDFAIILNEANQDLGTDTEYTIKEMLDTTYGNCIKGTAAEIKAKFTSTQGTFDGVADAATLTVTDFHWLAKDGTTIAETDTNTRSHYGFEAKVKGFGSNAKAFKVESYVYDPAYISKDHDDNRAIRNSVTFDGTTKSADWAYKGSAGKSNVISKKPIEYNPKSQEVTWEISLANTDRIYLFDTMTIEDTIGGGQTYVDGSTEWQLPSGWTGNTPANDDPDISVDKTKLSWTVDFGKGGRDVKLVYRTYTGIKDLATAAVDRTLTNTAALVVTGTNGGQERTEATAEAKIPKKSAVGKGYTNPSDNQLNYSVEINPYYLTLPKDTGVKNFILTDKIGTGLLLDESTVKLYKGQTKSVYNTAKKEYEVVVEATGADLLAPGDFNYDFAKNEFTVKLPADANTEPYLLQYTAYATMPGDLENTISLSGSKMEPFHQANAASFRFDASAFASGIKRLPAAPSYKINVQKIDKDGGANISEAGFVFELFAGTNTNIQTAATGSNGIAQFSIPESYYNGLGETPIYLREIEVPASSAYKLSEKIHVIDKTQLSTSTPFTYKFENSKAGIQKDPGDPDLTNGGTGGTTPPPGSSTTPPDNGTTPPADGSTTPPAGGGTSGSGSTSGGGGGSSAPLSVPSVTVPGPVLSTTQTDPAPTAPATPEGTPEAPALTPDGTPAVEGAPEAPAAPAVTVTFQSDLGNIPAPQTMTPGQVAYNPGAPLNPASLQPGMVINGQRFEGWYTDPQFKNAYKFGTPVTEDMVLYAKWTKVGVAGKSPKTADNNWILLLLIGAAGVLSVTGIRLVKSKQRDRFS